MMNKFDWINSLPNLWTRIIECHSVFVQTEECMEKLDSRKLLEGYISQFLSIAPQDRKFFLTETSIVLKKSVNSMKNFSAHKAMNAFQSISHYADNLATKPWRKEYRTVKMYSGYYQHEIKSNLVDAEIMFLAMGYKQLPNDTLVFEGSICQDQVLNVSRDAMLAYVECQIMMEIYILLRDKGFSCSWKEIFDFRQNKTCGVLEAIRALECTKSDYANVKFDNNEGNYANIKVAPCKQILGAQCMPIPSCRNDQYLHHNNNLQMCQPWNQFCNAMQPNFCQQTTVDFPRHYQPRQDTFQHQHLGFYQMSHSKSLEHYSDHGNSNGIMVPQRHSFDISHDVIDSGPYNADNLCDRGHRNDCRSNNFNYDPIYNVPRNRYALPYDISQGLSNEYVCTELPPSHMDFSSSHRNHTGNGMIYGDHRDEYYRNYKMTDVDHVKTYQNERKAHSTTSLPKSDRFLKPNVNSGRGYSFDDCDDATSVGSSYFPNHSKAINQEKSKNQDGIGSFENWDFVFKHLDKPGLSKNTGGNRDLQGLDLNAEKSNGLSNNSTDKRRQKVLNDKSKIGQEKQMTKFEEDQQKQTSMTVKNGNENINAKKSTSLKSNLKNHCTLTSNNNIDNRNTHTVSEPYANIRINNERSCPVCCLCTPITMRTCAKCGSSFADSVKPTAV